MDLKLGRINGVKKIRGLLQFGSQKSGRVAGSVPELLLKQQKSRFG